MQFIENIFLLQCLEKEIATAKELDLTVGQSDHFLLQTDRQTEPSYYI